MIFQTFFPHDGHELVLPSPSRVGLLQLAAHQLFCMDELQWQWFFFTGLRNDLSQCGHVLEFFLLGGAKVRHEECLFPIIPPYILVFLGFNVLTWLDYILNYPKISSYKIEIYSAFPISSVVSSNISSS